MPKRYLVNLAGLSFRPAEAKDVVRLLEVGDDLLLEREPYNVHDANAIKVLTPEGTFIGYCDKLSNAPVAALLDEGVTPSSCKIDKVYEDDGSGGRSPQWMRPLIEIFFEDGSATTTPAS